jgi:hypothetical protein
MDQLQTLIQEKGAIPLIVLYGIPDSTGVLLDFITTPEFEGASPELKTDAINSVDKIYQQMKA